MVIDIRFLSQVGPAIIATAYVKSIAGDSHGKRAKSGCQAAQFPQLVDTILVVLDGATPELARDGASRLAAKLAGDRANFQAVQEAEGGAFFEKNGLLFLPPEDVRSTTEQLIRAQAFLGTLAIINYFLNS